MIGEKLMFSRKPDRRDRFARNWKLVGMSSKSKWEGSLLNDRILSKAMSRLMSRFQNQTLPIVEDVCYEVGKEDAVQLVKSINIEDDNAKACLQPVEMVCLLNGIDTEFISENGNSAILIIKECPLSDILVGIVPNAIVCKNYFRGMAHAINKNARFAQKEKKCQDDEHCEFVITISI
jgi:hypothetical protein